jgi:hypothetical protein
VLALVAGAPDARALTTPPLRLDPLNAGTGATLLVAVDGTSLVSGAATPSSLVIALPRGTRLDARAPARLCTRPQMSRGICPAASKVGFGRAAQNVTGFLNPGGETEVAWSIGVYLGVRVRSEDAASVLLRAELLCADRVGALLGPTLGTGLPRVSLVTGSVTRRSSGLYGLELRFAGVPGALRVPAPATAAPTGLELAIGAVRRVREEFTRHVRVRTLGGYTTREVRDHRLVGHDLLRTPKTCRGSWPGQLRIGFPAGVQRTTTRMGCTSDAQLSS